MYLLHGIAQLVSHQDLQRVTPQRDLPPVAGGWTSRTIDVGFREFDLWLPAAPDELLEDPQVLAANRRDDYMPYWSYLWPSAVKMAASLADAPWPADAEILELGSGVGLVGLAAAARGWNVTLSDYDETALRVCRINAARNGLAGIPTLRLDWRSPLQRRFDVVLGCEVIYERRDHAPLIRLLQQMLADDGLCWLGDPCRSQAPRFCADAERAGFDVTVRQQAQRFQIVELRRRAHG